MSLAAAALAVLLALSPLAAPRETLPGWSETTEQRSVRYASIAADIAAAAEEACSDRGPGCRRWSVAVLIGVSWHESGWAPDVDSPLGCYRGNDGKGPRCDGGRASTVFQLQGSQEERALWLSDRKAAAREALRRITRSWNVCRALPAEERFAAYAGGNCTNVVGKKRARELYAAVRRAERALLRVDDQGP